MIRPILVNKTYKHWLILFALSFLILLLNIDYTSVNLTLVTISKEMEVDLNILQWMLSGYVLSWCAAVVMSGKLADIYGKRRLLLYGLWIFIISSIICALAHDPWLLIFGRLLQGLGGAAFVPPIYALVFQEFPENKRGFAVGMIGVGAGLGLAIGPSFGGIILKYLSWRWIFYVNVPLCLIVIVTILMTVLKEPKRLNDGRVDYRGGILLGLALMLFTFSLNEIENWGLGDPRLWLSFALSIGIFILFFFSQRATKNKLIPPGLFKNRPYLGCFFGFMFYEYIFSTTLVLIGLYLQNVLGYSAFYAGLIFLATTVFFGGLSPIGGAITDRFDARIPAALGMGAMALACLLMTAFGLNSSLPYILGVLALLGVGMGLAISPYNTSFLKAVKPDIMTTASGVFNMSASMGCSLGVIISTSLLTGISHAFLPLVLESHQIIVSPDQLAILKEILGNAHRDFDLLMALPQRSQSAWISIINEVYLYGFYAGVLTAALIGAAGIWVTIMWMKVSKPTKKIKTSSVQHAS